MMDRALDALFPTKATSPVIGVLWIQGWYDNSFNVYSFFLMQKVKMIEACGAVWKRYGCSSHLLCATVIQKVPAVHCFYWSTDCLCHFNFIPGTLAKPLTWSIAIGSLLKGACFISATLLCYMSTDRTQVIMWTVKVIQGWSSNLGRSLF